MWEVLNQAAITARKLSSYIFPPPSGIQLLSELGERGPLY